jgi:aspartyl aminopeptidase
MVSQKYAVTKELLDTGRAYASRIIEGLNASPSHFHAVNYCKQQLKDNGFIEIKET